MQEIYLVFKVLYSSFEGSEFGHLWNTTVPYCTKTATPLCTWSCLSIVHSNLLCNPIKLIHCHNKKLIVVENTLSSSETGEEQTLSQTGLYRVLKSLSWSKTLPGSWIAGRGGGGKGGSHSCYLKCGVLSVNSKLCF